jgi:phage-related protein
VDSGAVSINLSQLSANSLHENVYSAQISSMQWSANAAGVITVARQNAGSPSNTVAVLYGTGYWPHDDHQIANSATGNVQVTVSGGAVATLIMTMRKDADYNVQTQDL